MLACHPEYDIARFFDEVDQPKTNYVDCVNLKSFLVRCSYLPNDNLLMAIIRRLDLDGDAKLNYREFIDALRPQENYMPLLERARASHVEQKSRKESLASIKASPINQRQGRKSIEIFR
jgi:hypothetical protein